jgi:Novel STAND NTPase 1
VSLTEGRGRVDLAAPSLAELSEMVRKPAKLSGIEFEEHLDTGLSLDAMLIEEARTEPGALPLLSFALNVLYIKDVLEAHGNTLTQASYATLRTLRGAIAERAQQIYDRQQPEVRDAWPTVLRALVTLKDPAGGIAISRSAPLAQFPPGTSVRRLVDAFTAADARLLVGDESSDGEPMVRLAHEALLTHWPLTADQIDDDKVDLTLRMRIEMFLGAMRGLSASGRIFLPEAMVPSAVELATRRADSMTPELLQVISESADAYAQSLQSAPPLLQPEMPLPAVQPGRAVKPLRIYIASAGDMADALKVADRVIARASREFAHFYKLEGMRWEHEGMLAAGHFQDAITTPGSADIALFLFGHRLGTQLPPNYVGPLSGRSPVTGVEWEFETAMASLRVSGRPKVFVFRTTRMPMVGLGDRALVEQMQQQLAIMEEFWQRWFVALGDQIKNAYTNFNTLEELDTQLDSMLRSLLVAKFESEKAA